MAGPGRPRLSAKKKKITITARVLPSMAAFMRVNGGYTACIERAVKVMMKGGRCKR